MTWTPMAARSSWTTRSRQRRREHGNLIGLPDRSSTPACPGKYYRQGDAVQVVTINGTPTGGTFTVTVGGQTTAAGLQRCRLHGADRRAGARGA
jgi:hypothetical protein